MTTTVQLSALTQEQLIEVFNHNHQLQEDVRIDRYAQQIDYITEILSHFKKSLSICTISLYGCNRITIKSHESFNFVQGVVTAQEIYGFIRNESEHLLRDAQQKSNGLAASPMGEHTLLTDEASKSFTALADNIANRFLEILQENHDKHQLLEYFMQYYATEVIPDAYILISETGESDFVLRETITVEKAYSI